MTSSKCHGEEYSELHAVLKYLFEHGYYTEKEAALRHQEADEYSRQNSQWASQAKTIDHRPKHKASEVNDHWSKGKQDQTEGHAVHSSLLPCPDRRQRLDAITRYLAVRAEPFNLHGKGLAVNIALKNRLHAASMLHTMCMSSLPEEGSKLSSSEPDNSALTESLSVPSLWEIVYAKHRDLFWRSESLATISKRDLGPIPIPEDSIPEPPVLKVVTNTKEHIDAALSHFGLNPDCIQEHIDVALKHFGLNPGQQACLSGQRPKVASPL